MYRTHTCQELRKEHANQEVVLSGWVHRRRDHGELIFVDLRDRYGLTQVVFDPSVVKEAHSLAGELRSEFVIQVKGKVVVRPDAQVNKAIETGEIELQVSELRILNRALTTPFEIDSTQEPNEELRLKYRYLDLRRERMKKNILFRHRFIKRTRDLMDAEGFVEVETPMLMKGTPEGSREFLVPARLYPGTFYVLPQSPQQLKQLLMVGGMDRYFQVARCFRDEDSRGDRQPEFTQLDVEMSFVDEEDIMAVNEKVLKTLFTELVPHKKLLADPFPRLTWHEALSRFGSDKPDLRFGMEFCDLSEEFARSEFNVFKKNVEAGGVVKALLVEGQASWSRKELDDLTELAKIHGLQGLAYLKWTEEGINSPIAKFISEELMQSMLEKLGAKQGDLVLFSSSDEFETACNALGQVRLVCGDKLELRDPNILACCWVVDFPLLEWNKEANRYFAAHHPFTSPKLDQVEMLDTAPGKVLAKAYDIAMNGSEIGGGSIRIHSPEIQQKLFQVLGLSDEEIQSRFGHMIEAFRYGAPPHGGIAWGLDRIIMLLMDEPNIREVIAFPKDSKAKDLMSGAPAAMPEEAVHEMHIQLLHKE